MNEAARRALKSIAKDANSARLGKRDPRGPALTITVAEAKAKAPDEPDAPADEDDEQDEV